MVSGYSPTLSNTRYGDGIRDTEKVVHRNKKRSRSGAVQVILLPR